MGDGVVLGIDFGTSNTVAVLAAPGREPRTLPMDGAAWMTSSIFVEDDGRLLVGRDADRQARLSPERYEGNPKRRVDDGDLLLGVRVVPVVEAFAAVLRRIAEEARRQLNGRSPDQVRLTHPAQWGRHRQNTLIAAARSAGLGPHLVLLPEPVAAAAYFASLPGRALVTGATLAVYDLGGGTFDCAVIGRNADGFAVLAESGLPDVGGVDFDQAILDHLTRSAGAADPMRWEPLVRPRNPGERRTARVLREDVRAGKEMLSRFAQADLPLPEPFGDTMLTRTEFEFLVRPVLVRTVEVLDDTIRRAGLRPEQLAGIFLVGGSSRIPLVASMIAERLKVLPVTLDQPETSVALGAVLAPVAASAGGRTVGGPAPRADLAPPPGAGVRVPGQTWAGVSGPGGPGVPAPSGTAASGPGRAPAPVTGERARRVRRPVLLSVIAVVLVLIAGIVVALVAPRKVITPVAQAISCDEVVDSNGLTQCIRDFGGRYISSSCTNDPARLGSTASGTDKFRTAASVWTACLSADGQLVVIILQTYDVPTRKAFYNTFLALLKEPTCGTYTDTGRPGHHAAGVVDGKDLNLLVFEDSNLPLIGYVTAAPAAFTTTETYDGFTLALAVSPKTVPCARS